MCGSFPSSSPLAHHPSGQGDLGEIATGTRTPECLQEAGWRSQGFSEQALRNLCESLEPRDRKEGNTVGEEKQKNMKASSESCVEVWQAFLSAFSSLD